MCVGPLANRLRQLIIVMHLCYYDFAQTGLCQKFATNLDAGPVRLMKSKGAVGKTMKL